MLHQIAITAIKAVLVHVTHLRLHAFGNRVDQRDGVAHPLMPPILKARTIEVEVALVPDLDFQFVAQRQRV